MKYLKVSIILLIIIIFIISFFVAQKFTGSVVGPIENLMSVETFDKNTSIEAFKEDY